MVRTPPSAFVEFFVKETNFFGAFLLLIAFLFGPFSPSAYAEERRDPRPFVIFVYGAPGCGSSAVAARLLEAFGFPPILPATLLANHVLEGTVLGEKAKDYFVRGGELSPDIVPGILFGRLLRSDCERGALFEGASLTVGQVLELQRRVMSRFRLLALNIEARDEWLLRRAEGRLVCGICGRVYDVRADGKKGTELCDVCSEPLHQRQVDSVEATRSRLERYRRQVAPLLQEYQRQKILVSISGEREWEEIYQEAVSIIESRTGLAPSKLCTECIH